MHRYWITLILVSSSTAVLEARKQVSEDMDLLRISHIGTEHRPNANGGVHNECRLWSVWAS